MTNRRVGMKTDVDTSEVNMSRVKKMLDSCRDDAAAQLAVVKDMVEGANTEDVKALAVIAMAAENASKNVRRLHELSVIGGGYELVCSPQ